MRGTIKSFCDEAPAGRLRMGDRFEMGTRFEIEPMHETTDKLAALSLNRSKE